jgi:hypothetical protein
MSCGVLGFFNSLFRTNDQVWTTVTGTEAGDALIAMLTESAKLYVFGAPYNIGNGMHDVHCNQGDPKGTQWYPSNGTWQDGCVVALDNDYIFDLPRDVPESNAEYRCKWKPGLGIDDLVWVLLVRRCPPPTGL